MADVISVPSRRTIPPLKKLNPLWALLGNEDDGYFGGKPPSLKNAVLWWIRNPFHNFTHYVVGIVDRDHFYEGPDLDLPGRFFGEVSTENLRLPLLVWNSAKWNMYLGWRPSGAFGIKLQRRKQAP